MNYFFLLSVLMVKFAFNIFLKVNLEERGRERRRKREIYILYKDQFTTKKRTHSSFFLFKDVAVCCCCCCCCCWLYISCVAYTLHTSPHPSTHTRTHAPEHTFEQYARTFLHSLLTHKETVGISVGI